MNENKQKIGLGKLQYSKYLNYIQNKCMFNIWIKGILIGIIIVIISVKSTPSFCDVKVFSYDDYLLPHYLICILIMVTYECLRLTSKTKVFKNAYGVYESREVK